VGYTSVKKVYLVTIEQIWEESRDYYLDYQKRLIGELLISPVGSIKRKKGWGEWYAYLHKRKGQRFEDIYLGREGEPAGQEITEKIKNRQRLIQELRATKNALKLLKAGKMSRALKDFTEPLRQLLAVMDRLGFFAAGIELVGSYCFKVYQSHFGVAWFPLRTIDVDFAIPIPYQGPPANLEGILKELGFRQEFRRDGTIFYEGNGLLIEFLQPRRGDGTQKTQPEVKELATVPTPLPCLNLLLDNKMIVSLRDIGQIALPSMSAFMLHKLLIASLPGRKDKRQKDLKQACAVAEKIITDKALIAEVIRIWNDVPLPWRKKINAVVLSIQDLGVDCRVDFSTILLKPK
jgi:hypothetical protein